MTRQRIALPIFLDRLAFVLLVLLALTFAFEIPFGSKLTDASVTNAFAAYSADAIHARIPEIAADAESAA